jgi:putative N6-adenine-specific DNA methylase
MRFFATCSRGTDGALRAELSALKLPAVRGGRGGVHFEGRLDHAAKACLHSRTAMRVLLELATFPAGDAEALYQGTRTVSWSDWLTTRTTLAVEVSGSSTGLSHTGYAALKVKDAVVDALREELGARPDVDTKDPDVPIVLHLEGDQATLSLDLAGQPLHRRGWRTSTTVAPLKETLAAAVLLLGRVAPDRPFVDPLCGSGTLAIEQALRARHIAPGLDRAFAFQRWPCYRSELQSRWDKLRAQARAEVLPAAPAPILAMDLHPKAIEACTRNAHLAGVSADVVIERGDARDLQPRFDPGTLCMNPPYGERLMDQEGADHDRAAARTKERKLEGFYRGLAGMLARHAGWSAVLLSGNALLPKAMGRKAEIDHRLWNGPIEVHLLRYRL